MLMDKEKKKNKSQKCEVGNTGWMGLGKKPKRKKTNKPNGHLSSPGTKMFQSQNISLVEFQGFREKSKLKRGSQTYMCVCVCVCVCVCIYIYKTYIYIIYRIYSAEKKETS